MRRKSFVLAGDCLEVLDRLAHFGIATVVNTLLDFVEVRYPFTSAIDFFRAGYWLQPAALHLTFAYAVLFVMVFLSWRAKRTAGQKLLALYFALTPFNNYAFEIGGVTIADVFGILAAMYFLIGFGLKLRSCKLEPIASFLLFTGTIFTIHASLIAIIYPHLNDGVWLTRLALIAKVFVLAFSVMLFTREYRDSKSIDWFISQILNFAILAIAAYFIQGIMLALGVIPYGLFLGAGFVPIPTFGATSIERGHFGKFLTPLFPLFFLALIRHKRRAAFALFVLVTLINISASSLIYFAGYAVLTAMIYYRRLWKARVLIRAATALGVIVVIGVFARGVLATIADKIYEMAILGHAEGGRGISVLMTYLNQYPLGISYGGSTLRIAPSLDEINSAIFALIAQVSFLSPIIIAGFFSLAFIVIHNSRRVEAERRRVLIVGIVMMFVIFFADILWFVPTIWAPMILLAVESRLSIPRDNFTGSDNSSPAEPSDLQQPNFSLAR